MKLVDLVAAGRLREHVSLAALTTYKLGGPARFFAEPSSESELFDLVAAARREGVEILVLGRGSNLVISDRGWPGLAVRLAGDFNRIEVAETGIITAGAAVPLPRLARESVEAGRGGLEFFVGIPGSVGGAIRMNAGGHGASTADVLDHARIWFGAAGEIQAADPERLELSYRHSSLGPNDIVLFASFATKPVSVEAGNAKLREITRWRRENQPGGTLNAGSVFKNPDEGPAGKIIDELGLKGFRVGSASVSRRHANFFEAAPEATASDVHRLVSRVREIVREKTGIDLEPEVQFAGSFDED